mgnify:CR=1 FL=1
MPCSLPMSYPRIFGSLRKRTVEVRYLCWILDIHCYGGIECPIVGDRKAPRYPKQ